MLRIHGNKFKHLAGLSYAGLAGSSAAFLLILAAMLFAPAASQPEASAVEDNSGISTYAVTPTVGISLPTSIDFADVLPTPSGATTTATANLTVTTTDSAGYSLYLYSSDGDNSLRPKISSLANISTINATAGDVGLTLSSLEPNTWGYNLGASAPDDNTTYSAVPTDNTTPIQTKDTSSTNSANDTYTLSFGAKVDTSIPSGIYSDTLTIAVVAEPAMVTVAFNGNGATSGSMSSIKIPAGGSQTLPSNTFTRDSYVFNGWNTTSNGSGTSYADGANYTASTSYAGQTVTLYAQWRTPINQLDDVTYMQDLTASHCANSDNGATATLRDRRDNNSYTIAKINGNCWMTQNLRIASGMTLTSTYSNVSSNYTIPATPLNGSEQSFTEGQVQDSGNTIYGYWYNFCAASAGTNCSSSSTIANNDICSKGWSLPNNNQLNSIVGYASEFSPVVGGYYLFGRLVGTDEACWWSSDGDNRGHRDNLEFDGNSLGLDSANKGVGYYVRCIKSN